METDQANSLLTNNGAHNDTGDSEIHNDEDDTRMDGGDTTDDNGTNNTIPTTRETSPIIPDK